MSPDHSHTSEINQASPRKTRDKRDLCRDSSVVSRCPVRRPGLNLHCHRKKLNDIIRSGFEPFFAALSYYNCTVLLYCCTTDCTVRYSTKTCSRRFSRIAPDGRAMPIASARSKRSQLSGTAAWSLGRTRTSCFFPDQGRWRC